MYALTRESSAGFFFSAGGAPGLAAFAFGAPAGGFLFFFFHAAGPSAGAGPRAAPGIFEPGILRSASLTRRSKRWSAAPKSSTPRFTASSGVEGGARADITAGPGARPSVNTWGARWGGDLWDSPTGRRRAAAAAFGDASAGGDAPGSSRKWYERGRGDASSRGGRAAGAGGGRRGGRGVEPGDSFGFGVGDGSSSDDDWVRRDWNEADPGRRSNHPGHSRTNPRAGGLHDDTDGAIPQGPGAEGGGGGKWWERRGGNGDGDGGVFHPLFRDGFSRSRGGFSGGSDADRRGAFHGGYAPPEGADTSPPGEGEFGDGSSSDVGPDDPPMRRRASQSEPPKFDDEETMEEYVARRAYADSFGMTGHDRTLGDGGDEKSAPGDGGDGEDAGGVPSPSAPSNEGMAQAEWEWRLEDLEAALGGDAWGATGPGANPGNDYLCAEGVEEFCVA